MLRQPRSGSDAGFTLIETLVALVIMGIAVGGILGGYIAASTGTNTHQSEARTQAVLLNAVEKLRSATYVNCATKTTPSYVTAIGQAALPSAWASTAPTISLTTVKWWSGGSAFIDSAGADPNTQCLDTTLSTCSSTVTGTGSQQLVTVSVTSPDNSVTESMTFLKPLATTC